MTLCVVCVCENGDIVLGADSQVGSSYFKRNGVAKIIKLNNKTSMAIAGFLCFTDAIYEQIEELKHHNDIRDDMTASQLKGLIGKIVHSIRVEYIAQFSALRKGEPHYPNCALIIASKGEVFSIDEEGLITKVHGGYETIGSGGNFVEVKLRNYYTNKIDINRAIELIYWVIHCCSEIDPSVNNDITVRLITDFNHEDLSEEKLKVLRDQSLERIETYKQLFYQKNLPEIIEFLTKKEDSIIEAVLKDHN